MIEANKLVVERYYRAMEEGDLEALESLFLPNARIWHFRSGYMSVGEYVLLIDGLIQASKNRSMKIAGMIAEADSVAVETRIELHFEHGIHRNAHHDVFLFEDGLIGEVREYFDPTLADASQ